jgi:hypothetical protein
MARANEDIYQEFGRLIDTCTVETPLQEFLKTHPAILSRAFYQGAFYPTVFPKFELSNDFVPDFVIVAHRSSWSWDVDLIEIEPPVIEGGLFNQKRQPKGRLRDAEAQITDWQNWMRQYEQSIFVPTALEALKGKGAWDGRPEYYKLSNDTWQAMTVWHRIIIGRRTDFSDWGDKYRRTKWEESGNRIEIVPWDRLLEVAKREVAHD